MTDHLAAYADELMRGEMMPIMLRIEQVCEAGLSEEAVLFLPPNVLAGMVNFYGLPIMRLDVLEPMIGLPGEPLPRDH